MGESPEEHARIIIDRQLSAAGWQIAAPGSPIGSQPTALCKESGNTGRADYVLYLDGKACGIIEAKRPDHSLQGVQEQSATYAAFRKWDDPATCWQSPLPFRFEANGQQIQFTDARYPEPRARPIFHFPKPNHLRDLLTKASSENDTLRRRLSALPTAYPLDTFLAPAAKPLPACQHEAITNLEASLARGDQRALIHMATGAGKPFTAITQVYRLIKFAKLRRVLFLVDRKSLGTQAEGEWSGATSTSRQSCPEGERGGAHQIRTVLTTYRDHLYTTFFPGRSGQWVPKTLIFAKTDHHADHIVRLVLDVFGKGDAFCKKIPHKATFSAVPAKKLIGLLRNSPEWRIAVIDFVHADYAYGERECRDSRRGIVDMVATGVDIKPLECLTDSSEALYKGALASDYT